MTLTQYSAKTGKQTSTLTVGRNFQAVLLMVGVSVFMVGGIVSRLTYLQINEGQRNRQLADNNRIRLVPKLPERGRILDRKGRILATSRLSHAVYVWPMVRKSPSWPKTLDRLSQILTIPPAEIQKRLDRAGDSSPFLVRVARSLNPAQVTALQEIRTQLEGIEIDSEVVRYYPNKEVAAHILGYTGEMTDEELDKLKEKGYRLGDVIGQMGVEAAFEEELRGEWGGKQIEVDASGEVIKILGEKIARAGNDIHLTIDLDVQKAAEQALGETKGAIVAIDPNNGAVLAMVSRPAFDPNIFSGRITDDIWKRLQGEDHPFVNRTLQGFPPASTFKIVTTSAGIESGVFSPNTVLPTYPSMMVGGIEFNDWNRAGFGPLDFPGAIAWSSDTFFYQIAMGIKEKPLIEWTRKYGFGQKTGIELANEEAAGLVPDEKWKKEQIGEGWFLGDTVNMSIGQGFLQASPLQVSVMFAVPANGGDRVKPHLLKDNEEAKKWRESLNLKPDTIKILQQGLRQVVTGGTGTAMNVTTLPANAGKSGTAEDPPRESHTWFGGYAPADKPEIVVVAFGENSGGGGGSFAAPKVRQVLEAYFRIKKGLKSVTPETGQQESVPVDNSR